MDSKNNTTQFLLQRHLESAERFYRVTKRDPGRAGLHYRKLLANYYRQLLPPTASVLEVGCGGGHLLELLPNRDVSGVDLCEQQLAVARSRVPHGVFYRQSGEQLSIDRTFDYIILSETVNLAADVQMLFERLRTVSTEETRIILNFHSALWRPLIELGRAMGIADRHPPSNWLSSGDVRNLLDLGGWEVLKQQSRILMPLPLVGIETLINRFIAPLFPFLGLTVFQVARLRVTGVPREYSVSVIVPARNESGNIDQAVRRTPEMGTRTEIIFVEGGSTDDTWSAIQACIAAHPDRSITALKQTGHDGKGGAVREGFRAATGEILMILDADLTMPPEELPKYYTALSLGRADFANGVRLVYPMERHAMQFLNLCANKAFSILFSWALGQPVKDTLCGTKVLRKADYLRIEAGRSYFGEFDPFGDFDLLFGANHLNLKIADIPIRYQDRSYGQTNINRWRHGLLLLRMTIFAFRRIKFI